MAWQSIGRAPDMDEVAGDALPGQKRRSHAFARQNFGGVCARHGSLAPSPPNQPLARDLLFIFMPAKTSKYCRWILLLSRGSSSLGPALLSALLSSSALGVTMLGLSALGLSSLGLSSGNAMAQSTTVPGSKEFEEIPALENLARTAAARELPPLTDRQRFLIGPIQPGLELKSCSSPVKPVIGQALHMKDRITVELRCASPTVWHIYVPVRVIGTTPVAVAAHAIVTGSVLTANDLRVEQHDMSELPLGFFDDPAIAVGLTAARPIAGGTIITNQQLVASKAVQHGQAVTLLANTGGMQVRMAGRALSDGLLNQRVKVQNLSSGKIVEGIARSEQVVEIIFQ